MPETRLSIRVQPNARSSGVVGLTGGVLRIRVTAPAIEGRANHALEKLLAALLGVPKSFVQVLRGHTRRGIRSWEWWALPGTMCSGVCLTARPGRAGMLSV